MRGPRTDDLLQNNLHISLGMFFVCSHCVTGESESHAQGFPSNACDTALARRRQPAATPTSRGSTWRSETIEKVSLAFVLFLFPDVGERKTAREKQRRLRRAAPACNAGPVFETFNQTFSLKFWHLVVLTSKLRPPPTVLVSLCVVPNQTAIVAFKYIQMPRFFFPNSLQSVQV